MHSTVHQSVMLTDGFWIAEFVLCLALLVSRRKQVAQFFWLKSFLWLKVISFLVLFPLVKWHPFGATATQKYQFYFIPYWGFYAIEALICFMVIRELFLISLEPLEGLRRLGMILFAWVAAIAAVVALAVSIGPSHSGVQFLILAVSQFQRCQASCNSACLSSCSWSRARWASPRTTGSSAPASGSAFLLSRS